MLSDMSRMDVELCQENAGDVHGLLQLLWPCLDLPMAHHMVDGMGIGGRLREELKDYRYGGIRSPMHLCDWAGQDSRGDITCHM